MHPLLDSLTQVLAPQVLGVLVVGVGIGFVVGLLPGLGGAVTLALMLPFTFGMDPIAAFAFLLGMLVVTSTTGDITATLFGIPGEATSAASVFDGRPMTRRGEGGRALGAVLSSSLLGTMFGAFVLALSIPVIRPVVLAFGPPEFFALTILGIAFVVSLGGAVVYKGFAMAALGLLLAAVGLDPHSGMPRFTFDQLYLWDGISLIPLVVGLFGGAEVIELMLRRGGGLATTDGETPLSGLGQGVADTLQHWFLTVRASAIGVGIGVIPGLGGAVSQFIAYAHAQQTSKHPERFGHGSIEGVVAAGAVNNAKEGGALVPTLAFGIPGSGVMAILLSAFLITGLVPGPEMLTTHVDVTYAMVWIMVLANLMAVGVAFAIAGQLAKLAFVRGTFLVPFLLLMLTLGAYTTHNSLADVVAMLAFAAVGIVAVRYDWPRVPFLLAFVLGPTAERYLFLSQQLYGWGWLAHPLVAAILFVAVGGVLVPAIRRRRSARTRTAVGAGSPARPATGAGTGERPHTGSDRAADTIIALALAAVFAGALVATGALPFRSALFPLVAAGAGLAFLVPGAVRVALAGGAGTPAGGAPAPAAAGVPPGAGTARAEQPLHEASRRAWLVALGWVAGFFLALWAVGLLGATAAFALGYLRLVSRERWAVAVVYAAAAVVFVQGVFGLLLRIDLPSGLL